MHKLLSPVHDFAMDYDILHYQYDRWLFKTITGAVNSSKASGCSPNRSLETKSFSRTFWQHQNLYLIDAVRQYGYPSFFLTISPYEWTFPFPPFLDEMRSHYFKDATDIPSLETLHIAHVLEQVARGYLTGGNCNRWKSHVFTNVTDPTSKNLQTFFYRFEFQKRGTLHLHMLVWVKDISATRADVLHASVPWDNADDAFTVATIQKSDQSSLPVRPYPDSFVTDRHGHHTLEFQYTEDDADRHIRAYITTILGSLHCRSDVQLADGKAMLLKYVTSYVTKMHESATSEGLYCSDITGYQAAHSFLRTVTPLEPEMVFQLSNIKVCWTDKFTVLFRPPFPGQTAAHKTYQMYLQRPQAEENETLLHWLRCHQTSGSKAKPYADDRVLVGVKYVSVFNPVFFYQHLTMNWPHRDVQALTHAQAETMPETIRYFSQCIALTPDFWETAASITSYFEKEGHKDYFINTIVSYVQSLHDILHLWRIRVVSNAVTDVSSLSMESLYPLSPLQSAILADITTCLSSRQSISSEDNHTNREATWQKYRLLLGKPGTGKSQVLIRAIDFAIRHELSVLVAAPVALLAQGYNTIFSNEVHTDTLHGAFSIPVDGPLPNEINHSINNYDMIVVDEASMISTPIFSVMASTFNRVHLRPVVVLAGDKCQQQPLQTIDGRITSTTSIINDNTTFTSDNAVIHRLHQQFRIVDAEYAAFLDLIRYTRPTQQQVDIMQRGIVLCPEGHLTDQQIWVAFQTHSNANVMTVSRKGAQRINSIVVGRLFQGRPLSNIPCASVADSQPIYPYRNMRVIFTENRDKSARVVNGQQATIISSQNNTIILRLPEGQQVFVYPVTHLEDNVPVTIYPFTPAYAQTIIKAQGQNISHLIIWLDCPIVPAGTAYVGLSRVRKKSAISLLQPISAQQLTRSNYEETIISMKSRKPLVLSFPLILCLTPTHSKRQHNILTSSILQTRNMISTKREHPSRDVPRVRSCVGEHELR